jgi:sugar fermentation stimulation protein A
MALDIPHEQGTYTLIIEVLKPFKTRVGALGFINFREGFYSYTGSARGKFLNLNSRLSRHLTVGKSLHWHIDYLLEAAKIRAVVLCVSSKDLECPIVEALGENCCSEVIAKGFGSSDCRSGCESHLYYHPKLSLWPLIKKIRSIYLKFSGEVKIFTPL